MFSPAQTERAGLLLALGRVQEAAHWAQERGLTDADKLSYPREREYLVMARLLMAQSEPSRPLRLLERLDALAEGQGRTGNLLEIRALRSLALHAVGDHNGAVSLVAETLALAHPEGYIRVFADEGPPMAALLRSLSSKRRVAVRSAAVSEHLHQILAAFRRPKEQTGSATLAGTSEPLTERELEVLRLLAAGHRNRDIARQLVVTLDTVKKHTSHIFDKLGAANRTEAVDRARKFGILS
jgi:LuxR family transcriptional regulator, maltose regulon positive regulatory protein